MIYELLDRAAPLRQGDIFVGLPRIDISIETVILLDENGTRETSWEEVGGSTGQLNIVVPVRSVSAIIATQDCDALRSRDITLCEIREFREVERKAKDTTAAKSWVNIITQHARINQKWFYLPPDERLGFRNKMAVDFPVTLRVSRVDLERLRFRRAGRLNDMADKHFRERIGEFFRRYPYDEWYSLDKPELEAYQKDYEGIEPFPWQR